MKNFKNIFACALLILCLTITTTICLNGCTLKRREETTTSTTAPVTTIVEVTSTTKVVPTTVITSTTEEKVTTTEKIRPETTTKIVTTSKPTTTTTTIVTTSTTKSTYVPSPQVKRQKLEGTFRITCYGPHSDGGVWGYSTATGVTSKHLATCAVDPNVIPLGSIIEVNGLTLRAVDVGGGVKGNHIDIFYDGSDAEAAEWLDDFGEYQDNVYIIM